MKHETGHQNRSERNERNASYGKGRETSERTCCPCSTAARTRRKTARRSSPSYGGLGRYRIWSEDVLSHRLWEHLSPSQRDSREKGLTSTPLCEKTPTTLVGSEAIRKQVIWRHILPKVCPQSVRNVSL